MDGANPSQHLEILTIFLEPMEGCSGIQISKSGDIWEFAVSNGPQPHPLLKELPPPIPLHTKSNGRTVKLMVRREENSFDLPLYRSTKSRRGVTVKKMSAAKRVR
ncbi:hypothetical protein CEXT_47851 [Caerostris extrusa]|uniref:Uncharacterized protein n=1 Tax=Caerostris extrusa TaxID=172846 RepID=A0AAV4SUZ9_CAEEX|nr:hypothetical protein CEXT_47851 [Caerostris extrusa]